MKFNYDIRSPRHPDVQRARFEAELNCNSDTVEEKCLLAKQAFNTEIEKAKAKVVLFIYFFINLLYKIHTFSKILVQKSSDA